MHRFFVYNPVFAWVIAAFVSLFGVLALVNLPIEQYPNVAPPSLNVRLAYNGADADTLANTVTSLIEKQMNGVDNYLYMSSTSQSNGSATITVTFKPGTNLDIAQTQVQDRINQVQSRLPQAVTQQGVTITKSSSGFLELIALSSKSGNTDVLALGNFAQNNIVSELQRLQGVGNVQLFGSQYAMRIWLDPAKLAGYNLSVADALGAVQAQNSQISGGAIGAQPLANSSEFNAQITTQNRFSTPEQFRQIIVRENADGSSIRLGDVARVELAADNYNFTISLNGQAVTGVAIQLASGANSLAVKKAVDAKMTQLASTFPPDIQWSVPFDTTPFINASVSGVVDTLVEALVLVFIVMFIFLQDWRATLIPAITVPVSLAGACLGLYLFGFSINVLSLFAMVLAIGIVVDDAIVVVENVDRVMKDTGLNPRLATAQAMKEITGAIVGITLVLVAVFVPMAFFPGSTGAIYRQFSVTLAISILFSATLALSLTPAMAASLLKHRPEPAEGAAAGRRGLLERAFGGFNRMFARATDGYGRGVGRMLGAPLRWLVVFLVVVVITLLLFKKVPGGFLPDEDQGYVFVSYTAPSGATMDRTRESVREAEAWLREQPQVRNYVSVIGFSFFGQGQAAALSFVDLKPWDERSGDANSAQALVARANARFSQIPGAVIFALNPPAIQALGNSSGFSMMLEDRGAGSAALGATAGAIVAEAAKSPILAAVRIDGMPPAPQLHVDIDRVKASALGLSINDINQTLSTAFGSAYANDFTYEGNVLRVYLQAIAGQRMTPTDVLRLRVRNGQGTMVPFSAFTAITWTSGNQQVNRYNGYPAFTVSGQAAPGHTDGEATIEMERIANAAMASGLAFEWTGTAYEQLQAGNQIVALLGLSLVVVFLLLAALYESWPIPLSVLMVIPFGVLGSALLTMARGMSADVYFNVGLITIIGLAAKNAILIVEFAIDHERSSHDPRTAAVAAARERLRPILMTSLAFILAMVPLVLATGASSGSKRAVGTGVMGGMLAATCLGIFFTPLFYYAARRWLSRDRGYEAKDADEVKAREAEAAKAGQAGGGGHA